MRPRSILDIILICIFWGSGFTVMKIGMAYVPSFMFVALRFAFTAIVLALFMRARGIPFHVPREWFGRMAVVALLFFSQQGLIFWGLNYTHAGRTAVILNTQPIMTAVLAHFFVKGDRLTVLKIVGMCLALAGVQALFRGQSQPGTASTLLGDAMILGAAAGWAVQNVLTKKLARVVRPVTIVFWHSVIASILFFAVSAGKERGVPMDVLNTKFIGCLAYLVIVATAYSFVKWVDLIRDNDPSIVTSFCFVTPVAGVIFGHVLLKELINRDVVLATLAVAAGIVCANVRLRSGREAEPDA